MSWEVCGLRMPSSILVSLDIDDYLLKVSCSTKLLSYGLTIHSACLSDLTLCLSAIFPINLGTVVLADEIILLPILLWQAFVASLSISWDSARRTQPQYLHKWEKQENCSLRPALRAWWTHKFRIQVSSSPDKVPGGSGQSQLWRQETAQCLKP